ncbi:unnamed protein product [Musa banksii]
MLVVYQLKALSNCTQVFVDPTGRTKKEDERMQEKNGQQKLFSMNLTNSSKSILPSWFSSYAAIICRHASSASPSRKPSLGSTRCSSAASMNPSRSSSNTANAASTSSRLGSSPSNRPDSSAPAMRSLSWSPPSEPRWMPMASITASTSSLGVPAVARCALTGVFIDPRGARSGELVAGPEEDDELEGYLLEEEEPDGDGLVEEEHDGLCQRERLVGGCRRWLLHRRRKRRDEEEEEDDVVWPDEEDEATSIYAYSRDGCP